PVHIVRIAMADAAGHHPHQDLVLQRSIDLDLLDRQWLPRTMEDGTLHGMSPVVEHRTAVPARVSTPCRGPAVPRRLPQRSNSAPQPSSRSSTLARRKACQMVSRVESKTGLSCAASSSGTSQPAAKLVQITEIACAS